jgi:hypothetical protein
MICGECKVFVTSTFGPVNIGGLAGADAECQDRVNAVGLPATYLAWLSDSNASPASRFSKSTMPYTLPGGETVATSRAYLTRGDAIRHAINQTESGTEISGPRFQAWTHTTGNGTPGGAGGHGRCENWTSTLAGLEGNFGDARSTTLWTVGGFIQCPADGRLYCFQQR